MTQRRERKFFRNINETLYGEVTATSVGNYGGLRPPRCLHHNDLVNSGWTRSGFWHLLVHGAIEYMLWTWQYTRNILVQRLDIRECWWVFQVQVAQMRSVRCPGRKFEVEYVSSTEHLWEHQQHNSINLGTHTVQPLIFPPSLEAYLQGSLLWAVENKNTILKYLDHENWLELELISNCKLRIRISRR